MTTTSSLAVFGPASGDPVGDDSLVQPATTYGMTKAMLELMINDYSRKGFVDGRAARLPTVVIRPGAPNAAASSAASAIFREPLAGKDYRLPLDPATLMAVASVESVVDNLITLHELPGESLGGRRTVTFPGVSATFIEMLAVLHDQVPANELGPVTVEPDPAGAGDRADLADPSGRQSGVSRWASAPPTTWPRPCRRTGRRVGPTGVSAGDPSSRRPASTPLSLLTVSADQVADAVVETHSGRQPSTLAGPAAVGRDVADVAESVARRSITGLGPPIAVASAAAISPIGRDLSGPDVQRRDTRRAAPCVAAAPRQRRRRRRARSRVAARRPRRPAAAARPPARETNSAATPAYGVSRGRPGP